MNTPLPDDQIIRDNALTTAHSHLITAPAGSGKTGLITQYLLLCLSQSTSPDNVLFLTFTNKAVNEAKQRVLAALHSAATEPCPTTPHLKRSWELAKAVLDQDKRHDWALLMNPHKLKILTFDKFAGHIAGLLPLLSSLGGSCVVEPDADPLYREAVYALFDDINDDSLEADLQSALLFLLDFCENRIDDIMPLLIDLLKVRDQWLDQTSLHNIETFNASLTTLIENRLQRANTHFGKFDATLLHAMQASPDDRFACLQNFNGWPNGNIDNLTAWQTIAATITTKEGSLRKRITIAEGFPAKHPAKDDLVEALENLSSHPACSTILDSCFTIGKLPQLQVTKEMDAFIHNIHRILQRLVAHLWVVFTREGKIDFIEVAARAYQALGQDNDVEDTLLRLDYQLSHILLDESQDMSQAQYALLSKLISGWSPDEGRTLFIVGDVQQSIYGFRNANVRLFYKLWEDAYFDQIPLVRAKLNTNFRSHTPIIDFVNRAFEKIFPEDMDAYHCAMPFDKAHSAPAASTDGDVQGWLFDKTLHESTRAEYIVKKIEHLIKNYPDESIAILVKARVDANPIINEMRNKNISFVAHDFDKLLDRDYVQDILCLIEAMWHPYARTAWVRLLRAPYVGMSWEDITKLIGPAPHTSVLQRLHDKEALGMLSAEGLARAVRFTECFDAVQASYRSDPFTDKVMMVWHSLGGKDIIDHYDFSDIQTIIGVLHKHTQSGIIGDFTAYKNVLSTLSAEPRQGKVQILTLHKAKGLEFDNVFLPAVHKQPRSDTTPIVQHSILPCGYLIAPNQDDFKPLFDYMAFLDKISRQEELKRLLYVGATRASKRLFFSADVAFVNDEVKVPANSFLSHLYSHVPDIFETVQLTDAPAHPAFDPLLSHLLSPRIKTQYVAAPVYTGYIGEMNVAALPSEHALSDVEWLEDSDNLAERIIGTLYHALLQRITEEGLANWDEEKVKAQQTALCSGCRHFGMPEPDVLSSAQQVITLTLNTLRFDKGRWCLTQHEHSECELALAGYIDNKWESAVLDRRFKIDNEYWIIDYKSSPRFDHESVDHYDQRMTQLYRNQLLKYKEMSTKEGITDPIRLGLLLSAEQRFIEIQ